MVFYCGVQTENKIVWCFWVFQRDNEDGMVYVWAFETENKSGMDLFDDFFLRIRKLWWFCKCLNLWKRMWRSFWVFESENIDGAVFVSGVESYNKNGMVFVWGVESENKNWLVIVLGVQTENKYVMVFVWWVETEKERRIIFVWGVESENKNGIEFLWGSESENKFRRFILRGWNW